MPIFEYLCETCQHRFELIVHASASPECPACHSRSLQKQLSVFAVGASRATAASSAGPVAPCGACGDPRGAGSCRLDS